MGTKLQYAINTLAAPLNKSFLVNQLSDRGYCPETGPRKHLESSAVNRFICSVDEMFDSQNSESIKKTMLMHEDIFKRQVRELHRLYEHQMKLMYELKNEMTQNQRTTNTRGSNCSEFSIRRQPIRDIKSDLPIYGLRDDPRELSASSSGESPRMPKGLNLETIEEECPSTSIGGTEQEEKGLNSSRFLRTNDGPDDEIDVELTLSIGCSSSKKRLNSQVNHCRKGLGSSDSNYNGGEYSSSSSPVEKEKAEDKGDSSHAVSSSSAPLNQNIGRSNWMYQDLSLNRA